MTATAFPALTPTKPARSRAAAVIEAWLAWRTRKVKVEQVVEVCAFATLLLAWIVGYVVLCPMVADAAHHQVHRKPAPAATVVVLR